MSGFILEHNWVWHVSNNNCNLWIATDWELCFCHDSIFPLLLNVPTKEIWVCKMLSFWLVYHCLFYNKLVRQQICHTNMSHWQICTYFDERISQNKELNLSVTSWTGRFEFEKNFLFQSWAKSFHIWLVILQSDVKVFLSDVYININNL